MTNHSKCAGNVENRLECKFIGLMVNIKIDNTFNMVNAKFGRDGWSMVYSFALPSGNDGWRCIEESIEKLALMMDRWWLNDV